MAVADVLLNASLKSLPIALALDDLSSFVSAGVRERLLIVDLQDNPRAQVLF